MVPRLKNHSFPGLRVNDVWFYSKIDELIFIRIRPNWPHYHGHSICTALKFSFHGGLVIPLLHGALKFSGRIASNGAQFSFYLLPKPRRIDAWTPLQLDRLDSYVSHYRLSKDSHHA